MTAQARDILIYNNKELSMAAEPLADYLKKATLPNKLVPPSTDCWRGYYSKWAVDNKKLFLVEWEGYILDYQEVDMNYLFPGEEIIFAHWYTGTIHIPFGKLVSYFHGGYASKYEGNMSLEFQNGILVNEHIKWLTEDEIDAIIKEDAISEEEDKRNNSLASEIFAAIKHNPMNNLIKLEELGLCALAIFGLYTQEIQFSWWIWVLLFLSPDIGMLGYLVNTKVGAITYNMLHHRFIGAVVLAAGYFSNHPVLLLTGLIILGHSSFDRFVGYGLKYSDDFKHTHLGWIGRKVS